MRNMPHENPSASPAPGNQRDVILREISKITALPALCSYLSAHLNDPDLNFGKLSETLKYDPGMTANILKLANSAAFGTGREIGSLQVAFVRLGTRKLFELAMASGVADKLNRSVPGYELEGTDFLEHSVGVAAMCEALAIRTKCHAPDMLFTAGLLHDMGKLALNAHMAPNLDRIRMLVQHKDMPFEKAEREVLGIDHAEAGAHLLDCWNLPPQIVAAVRWHHQPHLAGEYRDAAAVVHVADVLAFCEGLGSGLDGLHYSISDEIVAELNLKTRDLEAVASQTLERIQSLELLIRSAPARKTERGR